MAIQCWNERQKSPTSSVQLLDRKSPVGTQTLGISSFYGDIRRSPINTLPVPIPPITISNPSETCGLSPRSIDSGRNSFRLPSPSRSKEDLSTEKQTPEKKEKTSVMRDILAFVRKPSKKVSSRTSRFASAFSKSETSENKPLVRQSTFSSSPNTSSRAGRAAVTKQMSYEPKLSTKLKNVGSKMSLRLRKATEGRSKDKKSSGDEFSDVELSENLELLNCGDSNSESAFEIDTVRFEKVGQGHKKHELIVEEDSPTGQDLNGASTSRNELEKPKNLYEELKRSIETLFESKEPIDNANKKADEIVPPTKSTMQCPTFEIEPPSRRASFDPPRSPFLEFRSFSDTDHDAPSGESFEVFESQRRESSFEERHSSMDTSFDIYQSTSYDDQTSSFEIVDPNLSEKLESQAVHATLQAVQEDAVSSMSLLKSSIEIVDMETFQKPTQADRKSSLETHFDLESYKGDGPLKTAFSVTSGKSHECFPIGMKATHQASLHFNHGSLHCRHPKGSANSRSKSPILSNQTSSNYSSRDSYDSSSTYEPHANSETKTSEAEGSKLHYPVHSKSSTDKTFLCIDQRCNAIFEPRKSSQQRTLVSASAKPSPSKNTNQLLNTTDTSSGSEFESPSPRRALSASPKHTFTFRIVMKKVESSPDDLCGSSHHRERERNRRDSRRRKLRLGDGKGKSF